MNDLIRSLQRYRTTSGRFSGPEDAARHLYDLGVRIFPLPASYPGNLREIFVRGASSLSDLESDFFITGTRKASTLAWYATRAACHQLAGAYRLATGECAGIESVVAVHARVIFTAGGVEAWSERKRAGKILVSHLPYTFVPRNTDFHIRAQLAAWFCQSIIVMQAANGSGSLRTAAEFSGRGRSFYAFNHPDLKENDGLADLLSGPAEPLSEIVEYPFRDTPAEDSVYLGDGIWVDPAPSERIAS